MSARPHQVLVRLSDSELAALHRLAHEAEDTPSGYVRSLIRHAARLDAAAYARMEALLDERAELQRDRQLGDVDE